MVDTTNVSEINEAIEIQLNKDKNKEASAIIKQKNSVMHIVELHINGYKEAIACHQ